MRLSHASLFAAFAGLAGPALAQAPADKTPTDKTGADKTLPTEIPADFEPRTDRQNYEQRDSMIPMRDGVKLKTVILVPKGTNRAPILMTRTPYDAASRVAPERGPTMAAAVKGTASDTAIAAGYILVAQDVRGKHGSEGDYVMNRPLRGPQNPTDVDDSTDAYDTIEWLIHNVPETNGRVGVMGTSYDGFETLMPLFNPHPALHAAVPIAPMVDGWIGDDWFHNGAFRQVSLPYVYRQETTRGSKLHFPETTNDEYTEWLAAGSAGEMGKIVGAETLGFWRKLTEHPNYDAFWQDQAVDKLLARQELRVPMLLVDGQWDQEDIYGAPAVYRALAAKDPDHKFVHLAMGPWNHGGSNRDASMLGAIKFKGGDNALWFREHVLQPFLDANLKDGAAPADTPPVLAFETGTDRWARFDAWPRSCDMGCAEKSRSLYLRAGGKLSFEAPGEGRDSFDEYVSDPAKPVPYRLRPISQTTWRQWLVDDQRDFADRPDVLTYETDALTAPVHIAGQPFARLFAATTGTDADWVVKLIDVYPDIVPENPDMGGYQVMIAADILRGRFREDFARPKPIDAGAVTPYSIRLPDADHVFLQGHRIMVQVQSSWFPLYDRNPQTYVENIFLAQPSDYKRATMRVYHAGNAASLIDLPVVSDEK